LYFASGRISLLAACCSIICADQPVILEITKIGVKKAIDEFVSTNNFKCSIICNDRFAKIEKN